MSDEDDGNGKKTIEEVAEAKAFKGGRIDLAELVRRDGLIAEAIDKSHNQSQGVIQTLITAVSDDKDYRQILKRAIWKTDEEIDKAVNALAECDMTGADNAKRYVLDRITARSAGINGQLLEMALEGLTHTTFTSERSMDRKKNHWWSKDDNRSKSNSPIA